MDVSCHSFIRLAKLAEPLMSGGGSLLTLSFLGAERVVENYQLMGPAKAALECSVRYMATELGPRGIRVNALSPGPIATRAAAGLKDFDRLMQETAARVPSRELVSIEGVGHAAGFLVSDAARFVNGQTLHVDGGLSILG